MSVLPWRQQGRRRGFGGNEEREKGAGEGQTHREKNPPVCTVSRLCVAVLSEKYSL